MTPTAADAPGATAAPARPFVTIAMPCLDEARFIEGCLRSVQAQTYPRDRLEVLVADGGSTDGTRDVLARLVAEDPRIRVVDNPQRIQAAGLNRAIRAARGEVLVRMDVHAEYAPDYVEKCVEALARTGADNVGGAQRCAARTSFQQAVCAALGSPLGMGGAAYRDPSREGFVDTVFLGAFRRDVFDRIGLYDEGAATNEDAEMNQRLVQSGGRIYLSRDIHVRYFPRESFAALARQYYRYGRGRARTLLKHRRVLKLRPVLPFLALVGAIALLLVSPRVGARRRGLLRARHAARGDPRRPRAWRSPASPRRGSSSPSCSSRRRSVSASGSCVGCGRLLPGLLYADSENAMRALQVVDPAAEAEFALRVRVRFPRSHEWEEAYVEHEMAHVRHLLGPGLCPVEGTRVLEFGCNVGATAVVLAHLGADVTAVDVDDDILEIAALNARRYGFGERIHFQRLVGRERLPFPDGTLGVIICNSVLEYVSHSDLRAVLRELDRVLGPGGRLLVCGTSNRLWPRELHSRSWFTNYLPRRLDRWIGMPAHRGVWPWELLREFPGYRDVLAGSGSAAYRRAKGQMGLRGPKRIALEVLSRIAPVTGLSPGLLAPTITLLLEKPQGTPAPGR